MKESTPCLTLEIYHKNKNNDRFLHEVCFSHGVQGWEPYTKALCTYITGVRTDFKVSPELKQLAEEDYNNRKKQVVGSMKNKLVFVGMGGDFVPSTPNHIGNHRIRTYIQNNEGILCFVEFGASAKNKDMMRCDHALINTRKNTSEWNCLGDRDRTEKRISELEHLKGDFTPYTKQEILRLVNKHFNCSFEEVEVYNYCLNTDDYTSVSTTKQEAKK